MKPNIVWYDIPAHDIDRAIQFYSAVLARPVKKELVGDVPTGWLPTADGQVMGCVCVVPGFRPSADGVMIYLDVNGRLRDAVAAVRNHGGTVQSDIHSIGQYGFRAEVLDSEGNCVALHSETDSGRMAVQRVRKVTPRISNPSSTITKERSPIRDIDAYIASASPEVRDTLEGIRQVVRAAVPAATETISYQMPAFRLGKVFFYFAAFKKHIGIYPPVKGDRKLQAELLPYRGPKGNLRFSLKEPIPYGLIGCVATALSQEHSK